MKKIKSMLLLACSFLILVSCSSSSKSEDTGNPNPTGDKIIGNWKLIGYLEPSGAFAAVDPCIEVFNKYEANAAFSLTADNCGDIVSFSGTWEKTAVANQYKVTQTDGTVDYAIIIFTDNNTRYYTEELNPDRNEGVYQKQ